MYRGLTKLTLLEMVVTYTLIPASTALKKRLINPGGTR